MDMWGWEAARKRLKASGGIKPREGLAPLRQLREAIARGDHAAATIQYRETASVLDKSVQKGVLHKNTANRYKSRLNARVKAVATKKAA